MWNGKVDNCPKLIKQNLNKTIGVLIPLSILKYQMNKIIDFEKIEKSNNYEEEMFLAIESALEINFISKAYLIYLTSNIESLIYTWFFDLASKTPLFSELRMKDIKDEIWMEYFISESKLKDFKHSFKIFKEEKTFKEFIENQTLGVYVFLIKRFNEDLIRSILRDKKKDLQKLKDSLTIAKELRNHINHSPYINDIDDFEKILRKIDLKKKLEKNDILNIIFEHLDIVLKFAGYNKIHNRLLKQLEREIENKNLSKYRINNKILLTRKNLKIDYLYNKNKIF